MTTRRLAAILAADVAGFSAMMERDEEGTAARIRALRADVIEPALARHHGRLVKTTGDGFLAEFASPVEAVRSALVIQDQLAAANGVSLRIGINLGDIIIEDDGDVFGDGVNVAARLEEVAEPGGIAISDEVHRHVAGKVERSFEDRGEQQVKNIARPVRVYAVAGAAPRNSEPKEFSVREKPSIAVLPFRSDEADEYLGDGIAEEVITALSRYRGLAVIARNSSFTFKGQNATPRQVGSALGVRYLLGGAIRRADGRLRISAELIDTGTGNTLWTDRFEGATESVFELQDEVSERVAAWIGPKVESAEVEKAKRKPVAVLSAYDAYLRGLPHSYTVSREGSEKALALFSEAIRLDPEFAPAHAAAAVSYGHRFLNGWMRDVASESAEAIRLAHKAVYLDPEDGRTLERAGAVLLLIAEDAVAAAELIERALTINPNSAGAWLQRAWIEIFAGDVEEGLAAADRCIRLNPLDPVRSTFYGAKALAYFFLGRFEEAYDWSKRSVAEKPFIAFFRCLAASAAMSGRLTEASQAVSEVLRRDPAARISSLKQYQRRPELLAKWNKALRTAGLPE